MKQLNNKLQGELGQYFWRHKNGVNKEKIATDGIHFTKQGVKNLRRSILGCVLYEVKKD